MILRLLMPWFAIKFYNNNWSIMDDIIKLMIKLNKNILADW